MTKHLFIGGMVAGGFDPSGKYLLAVSHSGRGLFASDTWKRIARDAELAYPESGIAIGIGPLAGVLVKVREIDYTTGVLEFPSPDGALALRYSEGILTVSSRIDSARPKT